MRGLFRKFILNNFWLKLFSFSLALLLWVVISGEKKQMIEIMVNTQIGFQNLPKNLEIISFSPKEARIRLKVQKNLQFSVNSRTVSLRVDLSNAKEGEEILPLKKDLVVYPVPAKVQNISPSFVKVSLEAIVKRTAKIKPVLIGTPPKWLIYKGCKFNPNVAVISGTRHRMQNIKTVYSEPFNLSNVEINKAFKLNLIPPKEDISIINPEDGTILLNFVGQEKELKKDIRGEKGKYKIWVRVKGPYRIANALDKSVILEIRRKGKTLVPVLNLPEGVKLVKYRIWRK